MIKNNLVCDVPPGIGLLGLAFQEVGYCIVNGPDLLWGRDMIGWHPVRGAFEGVIGGPPCKAFSRGQIPSLRKTPMPLTLIPEFERIVFEAQLDWWLMENVPKAPIPKVNGYVTQSILLNNRYFGAEQDRKRRFTFGTIDGRPLVVDVALFENPAKANTVTATEGAKGYRPNGFRSPYTRRRDFTKICALQGLPSDFLDDEYSPFTLAGKYMMVGNGVPLPMGIAVARAVKRATGG